MTLPGPIMKIKSITVSLIGRLYMAFSENRLRKNRGHISQAIKQSIALSIIALALTSNIIAGSTNTTVQVSATIASSCKMDSGEMQFGTYDPVSEHSTSSHNAIGSLKIKCTQNTAATISIDQGMYSQQASGASRAMIRSDGSGYLSYDLYLDPSRSTVWNTTNHATYTSTNGAAPSTVEIYGTIPGNQDAQDGQYSDVVTVTAVF